MKKQLSSIILEKGNLESTISSKASSYRRELQSSKKNSASRKHRLNIPVNSPKGKNIASPPAMANSTMGASTLLSSKFFSRTFVRESDVTFSEIKDQPNEESESSEDEQLAPEVEVLTREIEALQDWQGNAMRDSKALTEGTSVWKSVCETLNNVEQAIVETCTAKTPEKTQKARIHRELTDAIKKLEELLEVVKKENWLLLAVAISHELEALYLSQRLIGADSESGARPEDSAQESSLISGSTEPSSSRDFRHSAN